MSRKAKGNSWQDDLKRYLAERSDDQKQKDRLKHLKIMAEFEERRALLRKQLEEKIKLNRSLNEREAEYEEILRIQEMIGETDVPDGG